jgi:hypothetical protein
LNANYRNCESILFTIVSVVPISAGAFWATNVDKSGESATTTIPKKKKARNSVADWTANRKGKQDHPQDRNKR